MAVPIISVENLGKSYLVGHQSVRQEPYTALRDVVGRAAKNFSRKALDMARGRQIVQGDEVEEFWALKEVTFDVNEGDVIGIIGRNGAGKSTLLKILSRITEPTTGQVTLRGRVASLLEVGTGFHPELTGRENIFLNGAILGMSRLEIKNKFDEIVDFAGVEQFLDTPVKRYSSGMYVRLAFGVAAHLEPEILVVDEVLAVGDAEFQKKCLGKMKDVAAGGRTVLFVSHNLQAIETLCNRTLLLRKGNSVAFDETHLAISLYNQQSKEVGKPCLSAEASTFLKVTSDIDTVIFRTGEDARLDFSISVLKSTTLTECAIIIETQSNIRVGLIDFRDLIGNQELDAQTTLKLEATVRSLHLTPGEYIGKLWLSLSACVSYADIFSITVLTNQEKQILSRYPPSMNGIVTLHGNTTINKTMIRPEQRAT